MEGLGTRINMEISKIELAPAKCRRVFFLQGEPWLSLDFSANFSRLNSFVSTKNRDRLVFIKKKLFDDDVDWLRLIAFETISNFLRSIYREVIENLWIQRFFITSNIDIFFLNCRLTFKCLHTASPSFQVSHSTSQIFKSSNFRIFKSSNSSYSFRSSNLKTFENS